MWQDGIGWVLIGLGYLLALGLFTWLGGFARAAEAFRSWGRAASRDDAPGHPR